jgi:mediator of RNA polymerase II transcription subunit 5
MMLGYLQTKYKHDMQLDVDLLATDLIVASFDLLSNADGRKEPDSTVFVLKSFLSNKIPQLLAHLSTLIFAPDRPAFWIGQALNSIDLTAFPPPSQGMISESALQDVRQDFLFSCTLHSLIQGDAVESFLGEAPFTAPPDPEKKYTKEQLIEQCASDSERIRGLVDDLEKLDGNAGIAAQAIGEV